MNSRKASDPIVWGAINCCDGPIYHVVKAYESQKPLFSEYYSWHATKAQAAKAAGVHPGKYRDITRCKGCGHLERGHITGVCFNCCIAKVYPLVMKQVQAERGEWMFWNGITGEPGV